MGVPDEELTTCRISNLRGAESRLLFRSRDDSWGTIGPSLVVCQCVKRESCKRLREASSVENATIRTGVSRTSLSLGAPPRCWCPASPPSPLVLPAPTGFTQAQLV